MRNVTFFDAKCRNFLDLKKEQLIAFASFRTLIDTGSIPC